MATPTKYTYSVSGDFPNGKVVPSSLTLEIQADADITIALDYINVSGDDCDIWFKDTLPAGDETALNAVVAAHQGAPSPNPPTKDDGTPYVHIDSSQSDGSILTAATGREGTEMIVCSHNYCDKTTWYSTSTRVVEEVFDDSGDGVTFQLPSGSSTNKPFVDVTHGKVLWEEDLSDTYGIVVLVDDVEVTEDPMYGTAQDYTVNHTNGTITFHSSQSGSTVKVSYSYVGTSEWILEPPAGKIAVLEDAEIQFSADLSYDDCMRVAPWGYVEVFAPELWDGYDPPGPYPAGTRIELAPRVRRYLRHDQILDEARGAYPTIGSVGGTGGHSSDRYGYPLIYKTVTELHSAYGMQLRVSMENDTAFGGERATVTFYGIYKDET